MVPANPKLKTFVQLLVTANPKLKTFVYLLVPADPWLKTLVLQLISHYCIIIVLSIVENKKKIWI